MRPEPLFLGMFAPVMKYAHECRTKPISLACCFESCERVEDDSTPLAIVVCLIGHKFVCLKSTFNLSSCCTRGCPPFCKMWRCKSLGCYTADLHDCTLHARDWWSKCTILHACFATFDNRPCMHQKRCDEPAIFYRVYKLMVQYATWLMHMPTVQSCALESEPGCQDVIISSASY